MSKWINYLFDLKNSEIILAIDGSPCPMQFQEISNTLSLLFMLNYLKINPPPSDFI